MIRRIFCAEPTAVRGRSGAVVQYPNEHLMRILIDIELENVSGLATKNDIIGQINERAGNTVTTIKATPRT